MHLEYSSQERHLEKVIVIIRATRNDFKMLCPASRPNIGEFKVQGGVRGGYIGSWIFFFMLFLAKDVQDFYRL